MPRPKGGYKNQNGEPVPGCTAIISRFKDSGPLLYWAFGQGKAGAASLYEQSDKAAEVGTLVHAMFEAHRKHLPKPLPPANMQPAQVAAAEMAFQNALKWERQVDIESVAVEKSLVCECHQYGCTIDEIAKVRGDLVDFEWKTSAGIYVDHLLQTAAQKHAWECNFPDQKLKGAAVVRWAKESADFGYYFFTDLDEPLAQFIRFREAFDSDLRLKRRVR